MEDQKDLAARIADVIKEANRQAGETTTIPCWVTNIIYFQWGLIGLLMIGFFALNDAYVEEIKRVETERAIIQPVNLDHDW